MYCYNKKVLFSDLDSTSQMSLSAMMNAIQDCVNINSESIGRGIDYLMSVGRTWFAIGWNIKIKRLPKMFENIVVKTWPYEFGTSMGFRNVIIEDAEGEVIVCADSIWTLVDLKTGRPIKITEEDSKGYELEERYPMEPMSRKIKYPNETKPVDSVTVKKSNVDYNGHMSNGEYIKLACEYIPDDVVVTGIRVEYKNQSRYGELLNVSEYREENMYGYVITGAEKSDIKAVVAISVE